MDKKLIILIIQVNFAAFHSTYEVDTPLCSAKEMDIYFKDKEEGRKQMDKAKLANV